MKQYNVYIRNTNKKAQREFSLSVDELMAKPEEERNDRENEFVRYYLTLMPVGVGDCVANKICRKIERAFDGYVGRHNAESDFDYTIMKSGAEYSTTQYNAILRLFEDYNRRIRDYTVFASRERIDQDEVIAGMYMMGVEFRNACDAACSNAQTLCDILLDICYRRSCTKKFAWSMCGKEIVGNLLKKNGGNIRFPVLDPDGTIVFGGNKFSFSEKEIGVIE